MVDDMPFGGCYRLINKKPVPCRTKEEFLEAMTDRWQIKTVVGGCMVSTVFLAWDHGLVPGTPTEIFETMVFPGRRLVSRYCRYEDAVEGHEMTVEKLRRDTDD